MPSEATPLLLVVHGALPWSLGWGTMVRWPAPNTQNHCDFSATSWDTHIRSTRWSSTKRLAHQAPQMSSLMVSQMITKHKVWRPNRATQSCLVVSYDTGLGILCHSFQHVRCCVWYLIYHGDMKIICCELIHTMPGTWKATSGWSFIFPNLGWEQHVPPLLWLWRRGKWVAQMQMSAPGMTETGGVLGIMLHFSGVVETTPGSEKVSEMPGKI